MLEAEAHAGRGTHGIANEYALRLLDALPAGLAVSAPRQRATCLELGPLSLAHTAELFRSVFGDVQHLPRLVDLVYERSEGDPAHALDLAEHLSREGVIGFANGAWVLPQMVADGALPANRLDADLARLSRLSVQARELGRALSVREGPIPLEMCAALADISGHELFDALGSLAREAVLLGSADGYRLSREPLRQLLYGQPDPEYMAELKQCLRASMPGPLAHCRALRPLPARTRIDVPLLHLHGSRDGCIGFETGAGQERYFAAEFRGEQLEGLGHFLHLEDSDRVAGKILDFLTA